MCWQLGRKHECVPQDGEMKVLHSQNSQTFVKRRTKFLAGKFCSAFMPIFSKGCATFKVEIKAVRAMSGQSKCNPACDSHSTWQTSHFWKVMQFSLLKTLNSEWLTVGRGNTQPGHRHQLQAQDTFCSFIVSTPEHPSTTDVSTLTTPSQRREYYSQLKSQHAKIKRLVPSEQDARGSLTCLSTACSSPSCQVSKLLPGDRIHLQFCSARRAL